MMEADNSANGTSSSSSLTYHQHDFVINNDFAVDDDGSVRTFRFKLTATGNARYVEDSDDPGFEPHLQIYRWDTAAWVNFSDTDNIHNGRYADRGSSNYNRQGYHVTTNLRQVVTGQYMESYSSSTLRCRMYFTGHGGTGNDDLDAYYNAWTLTVLS